MISEGEKKKWACGQTRKKLGLQSLRVKTTAQQRHSLYNKVSRSTIKTCFQRSSFAMSVCGGEFLKKKRGLLQAMAFCLQPQPQLHTNRDGEDSRHWETQSRDLQICFVSLFWSFLLHWSWRVSQWMPFHAVPGSHSGQLKKRKKTKGNKEKKEKKSRSFRARALHSACFCNLLTMPKYSDAGIMQDSLLRMVVVYFTTPYPSHARLLRGLQSTKTGLYIVMDFLVITFFFFFLLYTLFSVWTGCSVPELYTAP